MKKNPKKEKVQSALESLQGILVLLNILPVPRRGIKTDTVKIPAAEIKEAISQANLFLSTFCEKISESLPKDEEEENETKS